MADTTMRLTHVDQCIANVAALLLAHPAFEAETLDRVTDILPQASAGHPTFGPVAEAVMAIERLSRHKGADPVTRGARSRACYDQLRQALVRFWTWRLMQAMTRIAPPAVPERAA